MTPHFVVVGKTAIVGIMTYLPHAGWISVPTEFTDLMGGCRHKITSIDWAERVLGQDMLYVHE
ncbi:hypothetical protein HSBAA_PA_1310 (plasmid) [Vreelandella sulfidaeris]|uniref:Uncharacterized protein n=1 Tax=Vreelandella sulfidaeris TaxID=115553 RepID=A0A455UMH2_9GAMM|nr:hypothetical protein HSBAA_PA_1310 [Halomonas sulfidaeris]